MLSSPLATWTCKSCDRCRSRNGSTESFVTATESIRSRVGVAYFARCFRTQSTTSGSFEIRRAGFDSPPRKTATNASLLPEQLGQFLSAMSERFPQHYPLVATLAMTGLRFCHASGLRWEDFDETARILRVRRRQLRGRVGPVTLIKRAPKEYPVSPELMAVLRSHRHARTGRPRTSGWMFPSRTGGLRCPSSLHKPWLACLRAAGIEGRFTVHGLRRTFVEAHDGQNDPQMESDRTSDCRGRGWRSRRPRARGRRREPRRAGR
jgi:integrase